MSPPRERIVLAVRRAVVNVALANQAISEQLDISPRESQFLNLLQLHGPLTAGKLASLTGLSSGTVTGVLDRLQAARMIERRRDGQDRRRVFVHLDDEAVEAKIEPLYADQARRLVEILESYDNDQLDVIADFMARISAWHDEQG
jgi:DNA-binding MarR family transcriptional regulator